MKKILFSILMLSSTSLFAQYYGYEDDKPFHFGLGGAISLPLGNLANGTSYGVGFHLQPSLMLTENVEAFVQAGVDVFKGTDGGMYGYTPPSILHVPLQIGGRLKFSGFFAGAGVGYGMYISDGDKASGFMYSPQAGYDFGKTEVALNYNSTLVSGGSLSYAGLKLIRKF